MKLTITTLGDEIYSLEVSDELELENFKAFVEVESGVPAAQMSLLWNGRPLHDDKMKLNEYGLKDGEVLLLQRMQPQRSAGATSQNQRRGQQSGLGIDFSAIEIPGVGGSAGGAGPSQGGGGGGGAIGGGGGGGSGVPDDPATIREILLSSPHDLALLKERNPPLAEALLSGDLAKFTEVLQQQQTQRAERERDRIRMLNADPFDPDVQNKIAEEIRMKNVESNMETAMEYAPESFGQVVMLYIDCMVNGHPVKAFVDSGAQMTIMSKQCAERCNIMRLVDKRWAGIAKGVGVQKIIGRVHLCQIQIGPDFLQSSFSILEEQPMDMLLGLDMLKRHQCCLDLKTGVLSIGTTGTQTKFLSESELPEHARLNRTQSESAMDEDSDLAEAIAKSASEAAQPSTSQGASTSAAATPSSPAPTPAAAPPTPAPQYSEADIKKLTDYGFPQQQVMEELQRANGNIDQALAALFAKSFQVPT